MDRESGERQVAVDLGPLAPEYAALKRREWEEYHQTVSRWEVDRYLRFF